MQFNLQTHNLRGLYLTIISEMSSKPTPTYTFVNRSKYDYLSEPEFKIIVEKMTGGVLAQQYGKDLLIKIAPNYDRLALIYNSEAKTVELHAQNRVNFHLWFDSQAFNFGQEWCNVPNFRDKLGMYYEYKKHKKYGTFNVTYKRFLPNKAILSLQGKILRNKLIDEFYKQRGYACKIKYSSHDKYFGLTPYFGLGLSMRQNIQRSYSKIVFEKENESKNLLKSSDLFSVYFGGVFDRLPHCKWETSFGADFSNQSYFTKLFGSYERKFKSDRYDIFYRLMGGQMLGKNIFKNDMYSKYSRIGNIAKSFNFFNSYIEVIFRQFNLYSYAFSLGLYMEGWASASRGAESINFNTDAQLGLVFRFLEQYGVKMEMNLGLFQTGLSRKTGIWTLKYNL